MSVIKQKFITINGSLESLDNVLLYCVKNESFLCDEPPYNLKHTKRVVNESETNPYLSLKNKLSVISTRFGADKKLKKRKTNVKHIYETYDDIDKIRLPIEQTEKELTELTNKLTEIDKKIKEDKNIIEQLNHLKNINIELNELFSFEFIKVRLGYLPKVNYEKLTNYINNIKNVIFIPSSIEEDYIWGIYFTLAEKAYEVDSLFATLSFTRILVSSRASGIPSQSLETLNAEVIELTAEYDKISKEIYDYTVTLHELIEDWDEIINEFSNVFEMKRKVIYNEYGFTLYGWISAKESSKFVEFITQIDDVSVVAENPSTNSSLNPPVVLKNFFIFKPFQNFVEMYGLPSYNEIDPTPLVAITYCLFFGIMFGDIGQGLILIIVGLIMWYAKKMWLGKIVSIIGIFSTGMGFFYGNIFGNEELIHGFKPNENINLLLITAVSIGVIMITFCSIINIINGIKQKRIDKIIFSPNGLLGVIFYWSILLMILGMINIVTINISSTVLLILIILCLLLLLLGVPLSKLIERKKDWLPQNKFEFIIENLFEMFEVVLSFVTNTISFIRIGAFALVHSGMMKVVFLLAETPTGYNMVILIIGNIAVIALEGLVVGIQVLRLEFFELFNRFYEGNGKKIKHNLSEKEE